MTAPLLLLVPGICVKQITFHAESPGSYLVAAQSRRARLAAGRAVERKFH